MTQYYFYCLECKKKGEVMTEIQASPYFNAGKESGILKPICCGKPMGIRSDNLLSDVFPKGQND